ncbi:hypothetical protein [Solirubrum puertoriconensis]|uniref:hypothetical protein n=1 Tax=Solirubrum puertoriconensis TaxID=1751427 RepID=UPI00122DCDBE|nr:hypothetical protein [Solirubrum puertoriconensis]
MSQPSEAPEHLIGVGFWYSFYEPDLPAPSQFVDEHWSTEERRRVLSYLQQGRKLNYWAGYSWCRFQCGEPDDNMGSADLTDGTYCWPEGLAHYIERHHVKLPERIVAHILSQPSFPDIAAALVPESIPVDISWWKTQRGWQPANGCSPFWFKSRKEAQDFMRRLDRNALDFGPQTDETEVARARLLQALRQELQ